LVDDFSVDAQRQWAASFDARSHQFLAPWLKKAAGPVRSFCGTFATSAAARPRRLWWQDPYSAWSRSARRAVTMKPTRGEVLMNVPAEKVFDFVADERNEPLYNRQNWTALKYYLESLPPDGKA
jgi:hypothetical protein